MAWQYVPTVICNYLYTGDHDKDNKQTQQHPHDTLLFNIYSKKSMEEAQDIMYKQWDIQLILQF